MTNQTIDIATTRTVIANAKTRKAEMIPYALELGIVKSKSEGEKTLIAALRGLILNKLAEIEKERNAARAMPALPDDVLNSESISDDGVSTVARRLLAPRRRTTTLLSSGARTVTQLRTAQAARRARNKKRHKARLGRKRHAHASGAIPMTRQTLIDPKFIKQR